MTLDAEVVCRMIEEFIRRQVDEFQREGVILGMSGGIDSALTATLLTRALGPDQVLALIMPERDSSPQSKTDALKEIRRLGIRYREVDLTPGLSAMGLYELVPLHFLGVRQIKEAVVRQQHQVQLEAIGDTPFSAGLLGTKGLGKQKQLINTGNAYARAKHRLRMMTLYYYADQENRLVVGTTNKSEALTGFVVKWGDNVADIEPILPLYKTQVRQLAAYVGVSPEIIEKAPSPDLLPGIVDELALGISYEVLDKILSGLEEGWDQEQIVSTFGVVTAQVMRVRELKRRSQHLREMPPVPHLVQH